MCATVSILLSSIHSGTDELELNIMCDRQNIEKNLLSHQMLDVKIEVKKRYTKDVSAAEPNLNYGSNIIT